MSIAFTATVTGLVQIRKSLTKANRAHIRALAGALYQKGEAIMTDSKLECPVDKGFLRGSGYVAPPDLRFKDPVVEIGYGKKYGPYVHERRGLDHPTGKDHFLKDPLDRHRSGYTRWIQEKTRENLRRGAGLARSGAHPTRPAEKRRG